MTITKLTSQQIEEIRFLFPTSDFDTLTPHIIMRGPSANYDTAETMEQLKELRAQNQLEIDKVKLLVAAARYAMTDLVRARTNKVKRAQQESQKDMNEKLKAAARTQASHEARVKARAKVGAMQHVAVHCFVPNDNQMVMSFGSPDDFLSMRQKGDLNPAKPYLIEGCQSVLNFGKGLCPHVPDFRYFLEAFAGSAQEKNSGRGIIFLDSPGWVSTMRSWAPCDLVTINAAGLDQRAFMGVLGHSLPFWCRSAGLVRGHATLACLDVWPQL